ncbi:ATP-binding protein [Streptomyces sp. BBFR102]|uniref:ATP-binding protein n=1 Tax=Streptomyces sp. BBFR102 TaxID=3448171 RepID=UPI003F53855B
MWAGDPARSGESGRSSSAAGHAAARSGRHGPHTGPPPGRGDHPRADRTPGGRLHRTLRHADLRSVPEVRRALRALLRPRLAEERADTAELLASELLTNALIHSDHDAVFTATVRGGCLRVEVRDFTGRPPRPRTPRPHEATSGRGLLLVEALADDWGVRRHGVGKAVWFELGPAAPASEDEGQPDAA